MTSLPNDPALEITSWLQSVTSGLKPAPLLQLFDQTFNALISRAQPMLGTVVLSAIIDRVLHNAIRHHPFLQVVKNKDAEVRFSELSKQTSPIATKDIVDAFQAVLTEFFAVIDRLTGEILTPAMYTELRSNRATPKPTSTNKKES